jgi:zinc D-Ala-D-Ala carboxypeptidase
MPTVRLSDHFTLEEMTLSETAARRDLDNTPPPEIVAQLRETAVLLEKVRALLGNHPVIVTSGYRAPAVNAIVGGAKNSAHMTGRAADFIVPAFGLPIEVCRILLEPFVEDLGIDQLIFEYRQWAHIASGDAPRHHVLTIDERGTRLGFG